MPGSAVECLVVHCSDEAAPKPMEVISDEISPRLIIVVALTLRPLHIDTRFPNSEDELSEAAL